MNKNEEHLKMSLILGIQYLQQWFAIQVIA